MYKPVIGLEIHTELNTKSKMFCSCQNNPDERTPNFNVCPICMGHPGTLPVINQEAVRKVIKTGLALNCQISEHSKFDRKNYFYPDLPKGYQISQYDMPFCIGGLLMIGDRKIRVRRVHLEEDTGRLIHPGNTDYSLVNFNRAGIPLMELVTEPDLSSAKESREFAEEMQLILRYLGVSNADMEKGQMRVEVNLSLNPEDKIKEGMMNDKELGIKVEIKNLNSFRAVEKALDYEIERQRKILEAGKGIVQETRGWSDSKGITISQREKEEAHDYRYFPEPDLPPLRITEKEINEIRAEIPELPQARRERFKREYSLDEKYTEVFVQNKNLGEFFEQVVSEFDPRLTKEKISGLIKLAANYLISDLQGLLKGVSVASKDFLITPENFAEFITLIYEGKISSKIGKMLLEKMLKSGGDPSQIILDKGWEQITDGAHIEEVIKSVLIKNQKAVNDFKKGKEGALQFIIGQVMKETKGKANPQIIAEILKKTVV